MARRSKSEPTSLGRSQTALARHRKALETLHRAVRAGGLYVSRDETKRGTALRALDELHDVLGVRPSEDLPERGHDNG